MDLTKIKVMMNLADSGQDDFVLNWATLAFNMLYEQGVSNSYLNSTEASYAIAKIATDLIEDGTLTSTSLSLIQSLRINHPHSEDDSNV